MTTESLVSVRRSVLIGAGAGLLAIGAGAGYVAFAAAHGSARPMTVETTVPTISAPAGSHATATAAAIIVPMSPDARTRAGIVLARVTDGGTGTALLRAPGVVEPNAYKRVVVTPIVAGRVVRVVPELGSRVVRGQTIAQIYSPELAEAQATYVAARAALGAHDRELARTTKLVEIGSASREELERVEAEHTGRRAALESASSRLRLLGLANGAIEQLGAGHAAGATLDVPAPLTGVVTERSANVGLNVDASTPLATIVDLSSVWVVADVYERDFSRVRVGTAATITTPAYPDLAMVGRVAYIDPQVSPETRTAKARIEVPNPRQDLRLGMLAEASFAGPAGSGGAVQIPRSAVQQMADRSVVYVVNPANDREFLERSVQLGEVTGSMVVVVAGLEPGATVVTDGSFHVRAERERLGLGAPAPVPAPAVRVAPAAASPAPEQTVKIMVTKDGFSPAKLTLKSGTPAKITFVRTTNETCATEVAFPSLKIKRPLPLNQPVVIEFTPAKGKDIEFACGMAMFKGAIVVD
jgi:membrane fusion protein, heavy metal efflux system